MTPLEWEKQWIDDNIHRYSSPLHALAVKGNIEKRARIKELEARLNKLKDPK